MIHPSAEALLAGGPTIDAHLARCPRCRIEKRLLSKASLDTWIRPAAFTPEIDDVPTVEDQRYIDLGPLGRGGMGEVIRATDPVLGRTKDRHLLLSEIDGRRQGLVDVAALAD